MNKTDHHSPESPRDRLRLNFAVRRAVRLRAEMPSLRAMLRACGVYANVIAALVALGLPTVRVASGSAAIAFESAVRSVRDASVGIPDLLTAPADFSEVTEPGALAEPAFSSGHAPDTGVPPLKPASEEPAPEAVSSPSEPLPETVG